MEAMELMNVSEAVSEVKQHKVEYHYTTRSTVAQLLATIANSLTCIQIGTMFHFPSVLIVAIGTDTNNTQIDSNITARNDTQLTLTLNPDEASWYGSLLFFVQPVGCIFGGLIQNKIGRKYGMMLMNIPAVAAWLLVYFATSVYMLHVSAILMGISIGFIEAPSVAYICEITEPRLRGMFTLFHSLTVTSGGILEYLIASFLDWRTTSFVSMMIPIVTLPILALLPDSPIWLLSRKKDEKAARSLRWLRGWVTEKEIAAEYHELCQYIEQSRKLKHATGVKNQTDRKKSKLSVLKLLLEPTFLKPLKLFLLYAAFTQIAYGAGARNNLLLIFKEIHTPLIPEKLAFLIQVTGLLGFIVSIPLVKILGKRKMSLIAMFLCCGIAIMISLYLTYHQVINLPWLSVILFCSLQAVFMFGLAATPWIMMGECFPLKTRGIGVGLGGASFYLLLSILNKTYIYLENAVGVNGCFFVYGIIGWIGFFYMYFDLPETEGKSLVQIEEIFTSKTRVDHYFRKL